MASGNSLVTHGELRPVQKFVLLWKGTQESDTLLMVRIVYVLNRVFVITFF